MGSGKANAIKFAKYLAITIAPVFLGSFILAGALAKYGNSDALNKTIIETSYKPSKEKFRECSRTQNRLILAEQELSGAYVAMQEELKFLLKNGDAALPPEYEFLVKGLSNLQIKLQDEIQKLQNELPGCYDALYSQLDDLGLLLGVAPELRRESAARAVKFNELDRQKRASVQEALKGIDPNIVQQMFREGMGDMVRKQPDTILAGYEGLAKYAQKMAEADQQIYDAERHAYMKISSIATGRLEARLNRGIWAFLFS